MFTTELKLQFKKQLGISETSLDTIFSLVQDVLNKLSQHSIVEF